VVAIQDPVLRLAPHRRTHQSESPVGDPWGYDRPVSGLTLSSGPRLLVGREAECAVIDRALHAARAGESTTLVIRGDPGIGKTALLEYAARRAIGSAVLRVSGIEAESDLAFAGLHGLLRPIVDKLDELPETQADALGGALGLAESRGADRFLISAATLSLLAAAADERPVVCLIDDAQWLDRPSAEALIFTARRLSAERLTIIFAAREGETRRFAAPGLPELALSPLADDAAGELLSISAPSALDTVRAWVRVQAAGNPLALLELPGGLSERQLDGGAALPEVAPLSTRLRDAFMHRIEGLAPGTRFALLIAAVDDSGEAAVVVRAAHEAGAPESALDAAEQAGLVIASAGGLEFRQPLVRSVLLAAATQTELRRAHGALAVALGGEQHAERRIWHQALASLTPDEDIASALEASARRAQSRAAHASAATAFARAAELTADQARRTDRLLAAARAAWAGGDSERARMTIGHALSLASDRTRVELLALRGVIEARTGDVRSAVALLLEAVEASGDACLSLELLIEAAEAATYAGDHASAIELGRRAARLPAETDIDRFRAESLIGLAAALSGDHQRAAALLSGAIERAERLEDPRALVLSARMATLAGIHGDGLAQAARAVALARERSLLSVLPLALQEQATALIGHSRFSLAYMAAEESVALARDFGQGWGATMSLVNLAVIDALRGDEERSRARAETAIRFATDSGAAFIIGFARRVLALLDLTLGRPGEAADRLLPLSLGEGPDSDPVIALWSAPDLIEAAARAGRIDEVTVQLDRYRAWAERSPSRARLALLARCEALAGSGDVRERFESSLEHADAQSPFQRARTELLYGEWLRREREPSEARDHLRLAAEQFRILGTVPWERRAEAELRATGETIRKRDPSTLDDLTPQERQIAGLVASGMTNRRIAEQLYLSPRTIDYHLRKVFSKLGLASRTELVRMGVAGDEPAL
jgi:DNA-binding CsgD family transcriptional regulator/tetratricopeptide (TPR) repeat protein